MPKAKILIIDDDEDINNLFKIFQNQDYNVDSYTDAADTLNAFRKSEYSLVLLDLKMEKIMALNFCKNLRKLITIL